jgi:8-oxo-dGDP phosphatase
VSERFRTLASRHVHRGSSSVRIDLVAGPDGQFEREVVEHPDAVAIVALDAQGRVALVCQHRQPLGGELLELPAGTLDVEGEAPVVAARRELAEEAGVAAGRLTPLGTLWNSAGWSDERTFLFLAQRLSDAPASSFTAQDEEAHLSVRWVPLATAVTQALAGALTDAKTVIGLLRAHAVLTGEGTAGVGG